MTELTIEDWELIYKAVSAYRDNAPRSAAHAANILTAIGEDGRDAALFGVEANEAD